MAQSAGGVNQHTIFQPDQVRARRRRDQTKIMGRNHHRGSQPVHGGQQMKNALSHGRVDVAGRFVGDDQLRATDDGASDRHALLLPARQRRRPGTGAIRKANPGQHLTDRALDLFLARPRDPQRQSHIIKCRQMANQPEVLEYHSDAAAIIRQRFPGQVIKLVTKQAHTSARRALCQVEQLKKRRFARPGRAGQKIKGAFGQTEVQIAQHLAACAVAQANAVEFCDGSHQQLFPSPISLLSHGTPCLAKAGALLFIHVNSCKGPMPMILTCPACDTKYVVKDGAIPLGGRKVRCASCKHSWHQDPDPVEALPSDEQLPNPLESAMVSGPPEPEGDLVSAPSEPGPHEIADQFVAEVPEPEVDSPGWRDAEQSVVDSYETAPVEPPQEAVVTSSEFVNSDDEAGFQPPEIADVATNVDESESFEVPAEPQSTTVAAEEEYVGYVEMRDEVERKRSKWPWLVGLLLLLAAAAAAFWFLAPPEWKNKAGIAQAGQSPLQLVITSKPDRQMLSSGNELVSVSGKVTNPTDKDMEVPPIQATLRNSSTKQVVHRWTIAPPAKILAPGSSASFNSAEVDIPTGGDELTISWAG